ncbi:hypothetical protein HUT19_39435 [Streptomyces sp. NA02950]|uniref:hypothetical protein n=1 Tax=Streptomyces sp. NA02950 TaxID=2742137 RepID=UPI001590CF67|nr:hypothetical protein [Streptomyces sp. NA02950]QKV97020.1 hypothetical protein HUT19_39435 [Streptomyces sp. NA02950]
MPRIQGAVGLKRVAVPTAVTRLVVGGANGGLLPFNEHLGALGMPGMTAYLGLLDVGR